MKKIVIALFAFTSALSFAENHVYGKLGVDIVSKFNKLGLEGTNISTSGKAKGFSGAIETTMDINRNLEIGVGLGYIHREKGKDNKTWKTPKYDTIPLYAVAKYNFDLESSLKPYLRADLGVAFNDGSPILDVKYDGKWIQGKERIKVEKYGLYTEVGVGVEYNNFLTELSYHITTAKASGSYSNNNKYEFSKKSYNNYALTLSLGYKFNF